MEFPKVLIGLVAVLIVSMAAGALVAQKGKGGNGGNEVTSDIDAILVVDPSTGLGGDGGASATTYRADEAGVTCFVGRRRTISLALAQRSTRTMLLNLGPELRPVPGEPGYPTPVDFFQARNVPNPSGPITEVEMRVSGENVSALGVWFVDGVRYADQAGDPITPNREDPCTLTRMRTGMRISFKSGPHQWRLIFGLLAANRQSDLRYGISGIVDEDIAPPVVIERSFPCTATVRDPLDPAVPWTVRVVDWDAHYPSPRVDVASNPVPGAVVGFLYYRGTKRQDPWEYAGVFSVRWGPFTVHPMP